MSSPFYDRLKKRHRHLSKWAKRWPTQAWRTYDRDMSEYPWTVDIYHEHVVIQEFASHKVDPEIAAERREHVLAAVQELLTPKTLVEKTRQRQKGDAQYEKLSATSNSFSIQEGPIKLEVNLEDYIDTGLFLDHRELRRHVAQHIIDRKAQGKPNRLLNLFCYTGAFSVWAGHHGAQTTNIDLSNTYLDWTQRNLELNGLTMDQHIIERSDIMRWLPQQLYAGRRGCYDLIILDPPTFSRSKKMVRDMDIQRDHPGLIRDALTLLAPDGALYFSTNFQGFHLDDGIKRQVNIEEITAKTIPEDFRSSIHRAWVLTHPTRGGSKRA